MKFIQKLRNKRGFTLVELIVVVAIIAILTAVLVPVIGNYVDDAAQTAVEQGASESKSTIANVVTDSISKSFAVPTSVTFTAGVLQSQGATYSDFELLLSNAFAGLDTTVNVTATITNASVSNVTYTKGTYSATIA